MTVYMERRDGRVTANEYRAIVTIGARAAQGPWCFTKADARTHVESLRRSLFDSAEAERIVVAESAERSRRARVRIESDRRIQFHT